MAGTVLVRFLGDSSGVKKAAAETEHAVGGVDRATTAATTSLTNYAQGLPGMGVAASAGFGKAQMAAMGAAGGAAVAGAALAKFALDGVKQFADLAGEVDNLQDVTGGTAEESSKFVAISKAVGVESSTVASSIFKLSKNVRENAAAFAANGIEIARNAQGGVDLTETMLRVGDAYRETAARGGDANKILTDAFGKGGQAMIDILERSREELDGFLSAAEDHGQLLSEEDLASAREYEVATRELGEAIGEVQRQLGEALIPTLTKAADALTSVTDRADALGIDVGEVTTAVVEQVPGLNLLVGAYEVLGSTSGAVSDAASRLASETYLAAQAQDQGATAADEFGQETDDAARAVVGLTDSLGVYSDAMDEAFGSTLDVREAHRQTREAVVDLTAAMAEGQQKDESAIQFKDRLAGSLDNVVESIADEVDAMAESGEIAETAASRSAALRDKLEALKGQYPALAGEIDIFIMKAAEAANRSGAEGARLASEWIKGATAGFRNGAGELIATADRIAHDVEQTFRTNWQVQSPSKVAEEIGQDFTKGMAIGVDRGSADVMAYVNALAENVIDAFTSVRRFTDAQAGFGEASQSVADLEAEQAGIGRRIERTTNMYERERDKFERRRAAGLQTPEQFKAEQEHLKELEARIGDLMQRQRDLPGLIRQARDEQTSAGFDLLGAPLPSSLTSADIDGAVARGRAVGLSDAVIMQLVDAINKMSTRPVEIVVDGQRLAKAVTPHVRTELIQVGKRNGGNVLAGMA